MNMLMSSKDHVVQLYANMLEHHGDVQRLVHKWLCQLLNNGVARPIWRFSTLLPLTFTPYSAGQMVNTYGQMQKWPSQVRHNRLSLAINSCKWISLTQFF
ncbi:hypothetical protein T10_9007 [Trichinella papuae]|uniref:Uncharacterized protein n=1 Tax=Trichinella papuae TaxID=268474 RepID=A0A0V1M3C6_9BILA|nr:hypothetical protein T10_9007 [Trichinella papuae]